MSKPVKDMMIREYQERLGETQDAAVVSMRGISSNDTNTIRAGLGEKDIHVMVVRNALFKRAFGDATIGGLGPVMSGANALVFGAESVVDVARQIVDLVETYPDLELKGAILDGDLYEGEDGVKRLSKFPTRDEAIAEDVTLILGPGRKLLGAIKGPGSGVAGLVKAIQDKLEAGEEIAKV